MIPRIFLLLAAVATLSTTGCSSVTCLFRKKATAATPAVTYAPYTAGQGFAGLQVVYRTPEDKAHPTFWARKKHGAAKCGMPLPVLQRAVRIPTGSYVDYDIHFTTAYPWDVAPPGMTVRLLRNQLTTVSVFYQ